MKILYLTPHAPGLNSGGGRHCYANLRSLCEYQDAVVDYIGPAIPLIHDFQHSNFRAIASRNFTGKDRLMAAVKGSPSSLIEVFSEVRDQLDYRSYDLVFIEFSYLDFIFDYLPRDIPTICSVHNVEADYQYFNTTGVGRLKYYYTKGCEKRAIQAASHLLIMHDFDVQRLESIYLVKLRNYHIHPVCSLTPRYASTNMDKRNKTILFAGSLNNRYNEFSLLEFLKICWAEIQDCGYRLLIAGSNPSKSLISEIAQYRNIQMIANPLDMEILLRDARLMVVPDLLGAGMKLRVAEALSYGVPVVGTELGLRGYEDVKSYGFAAESIDEMSGVILNLIEDDGFLNELSLNASIAWRQTYSFEVFRSRVHSILDQL